MKQAQHCWSISILLISIFTIVMFTTTAMAQPCDPWAAKLVSIQGEAMVKRHAQNEWGPIGFGDLICMGDTFQVGQNSRASLLLAGEGLIRVDQLTTLRFPEPDSPNSFWTELIDGVIYFFSHKPRHLKVLTPFVNANVEGTEFLVKVSADWAEINVIQGRVRAINELGELLLAAGQSARAQKDAAPALITQIKPEDAVQWALYYPLLSDFSQAALKKRSDFKQAPKALDAIKEGKYSEALTLLEKLPETAANADLLTLRAGLKLMLGRAAGALEDIGLALQLKPNFSDALALKSIIALVQNRKNEAMTLAEQAVNANPYSANGHIAQSYALQAAFQIDAALQSVEEATTVAPENAVAWSRLAELRLSTGELDQALAAAHKAIEFDPDNAHAQTVLGFAYLTQIKIEPAMEAFRQAIALDQAAPLPRLGMGLATIRKGNLAEGRREIEIAASLDSQNALIRSYLGKAYFDEKQDKLAGDQYEMAKALDSRDPTAWFYDALRKQAANRPVEALQDLQKSIALNDNRAVYRSRLLLDQDLAARSASLGRIYNDLGFQQLALVEGWKSLNTDPSNYSAHRFLADSYSALPRHDIARVSEILQSQLLQPINQTPIQPQLAESQLGIINGTGPSDLSFNEYSPLFNRNGVALQANGVAGGNDTLGNDLVLSGLYGVNSFSLGQFHYETDGFRENNDQDKDIYNVFYQMAPWHHTSILVELRSEESQFGDLPLRFDPERFYAEDRNTEESDSLRLGMRHAFSPQSDLIATAIFADTEYRLTNEIFGYDFIFATEGYVVETQHLFRSEILNLISGFGHFDADEKETITFTPDPPFMTDEGVQHTNVYLYSLINYPQNITWTVGGSGDFFDGDRKIDQFNPKLGVSWNPFPATTLRAAAFRVINKSVIADQTIEPTHVAGFNQYYNDFQADDFWRYGAAVDHTFSQRLFSGIEFSKRDIEHTTYDDDFIPYGVDWTEKFTRAYLYWMPLNWLSVNIEYQFEQFERDLASTGEEEIHKLETHKIPLSLKAFCPYGITAEIKTTYVDQEGEFDYAFNADPEYGSDRFWTTDVSLSYRLPKRYGIFSVEVKNIFDEEFQFQSMDKARPEIAPERLILFKLHLSF